MSSDAAPPDGRAIIAVDLGAESCRISLLRWRDGLPQIQLVHRFPNGPLVRDGGLRWPLDSIVTGAEEGLRRCAALAPEGIRSVAVDGWAVDYVRLDHTGRPVTDPFCYRDERTLAAEQYVHTRISPERLRAITGVQLLRINTLYQLAADHMVGVPDELPWLNLPEYVLSRWGGRRCSEYTNATHTQLVDLGTGQWSEEILNAVGLTRSSAPEIVPPGTTLGPMTGELAALPEFRSTALIAPACHDTGSAIAGISAEGNDWAYLSLGTWSLVGTRLQRPENRPAAASENFTNLGGVAGTVCFHKNVNGMWLLKQCMDAWAAGGSPWSIAELLVAAERTPAPPTHELLDVDDPDLLLVGDMPARINAQRRRHALPPLDASANGAPQMASLVVHSLAGRFADVLATLQRVTGKALTGVVAVGGASQNGMLLRLTQRAAGLPVWQGSTESATVGNFAVQLARLEALPDVPIRLEAVNHWASVLQSRTPGASR